MRGYDVLAPWVRELVGGMLAGGDDEVRVAVALEDGVPDVVARTVREALVPVSARAHVRVTRAVEASHEADASTDVALVLTASATGPGAWVARAWRAAGVPCAIVAESSLDAPPPDAGLGGVALVAGGTRAALRDKLACWVSDACGARVAFAANFPFSRPAVARGLVREYGLQNVALGVVAIGHGADLPLMLLNETRMARDLASVYGVTPGPVWVAALGAMLASALASRGASRALVRAAPPLAPLVRGGVAYGSTSAIGALLSAVASLAGRAARDGDVASSHVTPVDEARAKA